MSTHNIGFYEHLTKIIFQLSSNTHLISSSEVMDRSCLYWCKGMSVTAALHGLQPGENCVNENRP